MYYCIPVFLLCNFPQGGPAQCRLDTGLWGKLNSGLGGKVLTT